MYGILSLLRDSGILVAQQWGLDAYSFFSCSAISMGVITYLEDVQDGSSPEDNGAPSC